MRLVLAPITTLLLLTTPAGELTQDAGVSDAKARFGFVVEVGLPEGLAVGVQVKAAPDIKLDVAAATNAVGFGVRASVAIFPLPKVFRVFRPLVAADVGGLFEGDASWIPGLAPAWQAALSKASYFFCGAQGGFELGSPNVAFVLKLGVTYLAGKLPTLTVPLPNSGVLAATGIVVSGLLPTAKVGLSVAFD